MLFVIQGSKHMRDITHRLGIGIAVLLVFSASAALAQGSPEMRGEALASQHCAMCHAIGSSESSPNPLARPFRTLGQTYSIPSIEAPLREGALFGHPMMPGFTFSSRDAHAIMRYLQSIQAR